MEKLYSYSYRLNEIKKDLNHDCGMRQCPSFSAEIHAERRKAIKHLEEFLEIVVKELR